MQVLGTNLTDAIVPQKEDNPENRLSLKTVKEPLQYADCDRTWTQVSSREYLTALSRDIHWLRLWDEARDHGIQGARSIISILRVITMPVFSDDFSCSMCGLKGCLPASHITEAHLGCHLNDLLDFLRYPCEKTFIM